MLRMQFITNLEALSTQVKVWAIKALVTLIGGNISLATSVTENALHLELVVLWMNLVPFLVTLPTQVVICTFGTFVMIARVKRMLSTAIADKLAAWTMPIARFENPGVMVWVDFDATIMAPFAEVVVIAGVTLEALTDDGGLLASIADDAIVYFGGREDVWIRHACVIVRNTSGHDREA